MKDVGKLLGVDITENDISVSHRMPQSQKHKGKPGPPAIIVKFARRDVKDNFYRARKQLKDLTTRDLGYSEKNKIYLAESLTERNRMLFKDCLKVKEGYGVQVHLDFKWKNLHEKRQRLCCSPY